MWGVWLCLSSLHVLGYPCVLHGKKKKKKERAQVVASGFMPGVGCLAAVSGQGLAGLLCEQQIGAVVNEEVGAPSLAARLL